jgi:zinc transport system substrate-binding protein
MDPHSYGLQAKEVSDALVRVYPESKAEIAGNYSSLATKLDQLDKRTAAAVEAVGAMDFASNHPSYNYLFRRYGKSVRVFDVNPTENPDVALRLSITGWAAEVGMPVLLWESKPSESVVGLLPGMRHVVVDPLEQPVSGRYDYLQQANANLTVWRSLLGDLADQGLGGE